MLTRVNLTGLAIAASLIAAPVTAQDWRPDDTVTLVVPSSPGGGHDTNARALAAVMEKYAGQSIVVENQAGGGGVVAYNQMEAAKPDGLTLGQVSTSLVTDAYRLSNVNYGADTFRYVGQISAAGAAPGSSVGRSPLDPARRVGQLGQPGLCPLCPGEDRRRGVPAHPDQGRARHPAVDPRRGSRGGLLYPSEVKAQYDAGEIKVLAHKDEAPVPGFDGVESFREQGVDLGLSVWRALVLPKDTPDEIARGWEEILRRTMEDPALKQAYDSVFVGYAYADAAGTTELVNRSAEELGAISREAGIVKE